MQYKKPWNWSWSWLKKKRKKDQSKHVMLRGRRTIPIQRQRRSPFRFVFTWKQIWAIRNALTIVRGCGCINNNNGTWLGLTYKWLWLFLGLTKHQTAIHEGKTCKAPKKKKFFNKAMTEFKIQVSNSNLRPNHTPHKKTVYVREQAPRGHLLNAWFLTNCKLSYYITKIVS